MRTLFASLFLIANTALSQSSPGCISSLPLESPLPGDVTVLPDAFRYVDGVTYQPPFQSDGFLYRYKFTFQTKEYAVTGLSSLAKLLRETQALAQLKDKSTLSDVADASVHSGIALVTAPVRAVQKLGDAINSPEQTWETIKSVPDGISGFFDEIGDKADKYWKLAKRSVTGEGKSKTKARTKLKTRAADESSSLALDWAGYSDTEKDIYRENGLDPHTENQELREAIRTAAATQASVRFAFRFVPGIGGIAYVSDLNRGLTYAKRLSVYADPKELRNKNLKALIEAGYDAGEVKSILDKKNLTPTLSTRLTSAVTELSRLPGAKGLLGTFERADSREEAISLIENLEYIAFRLHDGNQISAVYPELPIVGALRRDGTLIEAMPFDSLFLVQDTAKWFCTLRDFAAKNADVKKVEIRLRGKASVEAVKVMEQYRFKFIESVRFPSETESH